MATPFRRQTATARPSRSPAGAWPSMPPVASRRQRVDTGDSLTRYLASAGAGIALHLLATAAARFSLMAISATAFYDARHSRKPPPRAARQPQFLDVAMAWGGDDFLAIAASRGASIILLARLYARHLLGRSSAKAGRLRRRFRVARQKYHASRHCRFSLRMLFMPSLH